MLSHNSLIALRICIRSLQKKYLESSSLVPRLYSTAPYPTTDVTQTGQLRFGIVGSGPAGFYTASLVIYTSRITSLYILHCTWISMTPRNHMHVSVLRTGVLQDHMYVSYHSQAVHNV